jgi:formylglycine-generating enzyme required for sulfatase activity
MGKKIALLIGVSEYEPGLNPLPGAVNDVDAMQRVLANPEMGEFADIAVLKNPQRQDIEDAIYKLFANRSKDDLLLLYFSGHGIKDEIGRLYLSTRATRKDNGKLVKPSAVTANFLNESIKDSQSQRKVIILDCCFSGAIATGMTVKDDGNVDIQQQLGGKGRAILTSSTSTQYSFEQEGSELSIYTRYMVEGIEKGAADRDSDGYISIEELHEYASAKVQEESPAMTPQFYRFDDGDKIFLAKSPKDDPKLKYRKEVESRVTKGKGKLSTFKQAILDGKRDDLRISLEEAEIILNEVLQPYREYEAKLNKFKETLIKAINHQYPFSQDDEEALKEYQKYLGLEDKDILLIREQLLAPKQAEYEQQQRELEQLRQQELIKQQREAEKLQQEELLKQQQEEQLRQEQERAEYNRLQAELRQKAQSAEKLRKQSSSVIQAQAFEFQYATLAGFEERSQFLGFGKKTVPKIVYHQARAEYFTEDLGNGVTLEMVAIPGGTFMMGSPENEAERLDSESPQHKVTIQPFFMGKYPITQKQWAAVAALPKVKIELNSDPSQFKGGNLPIECISWDEATEFCSRLSQYTQKQNPNKTYRLPSEAEWEYACRAGTTTPFHFGETITTELANYNGKYIYGNSFKDEYREETTEVAQFSPNAFGLYDMHGNVWEWCQDDWHENYESAPIDGDAWLDDNNNQSLKMLRGGSWFLIPRYCRSAYRYGIVRDYWYSYIGFRVVCAFYPGLD